MEKGKETLCSSSPLFFSPLKREWELDHQSNLPTIILEIHSLPIQSQKCCYYFLAVPHQNPFWVAGRPMQCYPVLGCTHMSVVPERLLSQSSHLINSPLKRVDVWTSPKALGPWESLHTAHLAFQEMWVSRGLISNLSEVKTLNSEIVPFSFYFVCMYVCAKKATLS